MCPPSPQPVPAGDLDYFVATLAAPLPPADPTNHYQVAVVVDQDDNPADNYQPGAQFPDDFFKDSDLWFEADYAPGAGWTLKATDARNSTPKPVATQARIIFHDNVVNFVIPAAEIQSASPKFRITTFRHTGDFGLGPTHDWSGSIQPPVAMGLHAFGAPRPAAACPAPPEAQSVNGTSKCTPLFYSCGTTPCCLGTCGADGICVPATGTLPASCSPPHPGCCWPTGYSCDAASPCCSGTCDTNGICQP